MPCLHVVVPVYNELKTLGPCLRRVVGVRLPESWTLSLRLVDDHSDPPGHEEAQRVVRELAGDGYTIGITRHETNRGKGAALQTGFDDILVDADAADIVTIQDADLEYDPEDLPRLMQPVLDGTTRAVVGTRWGDHTPLHGLKRRVHAIGNGTLTWMSNAMTGYDLTDMECCYKMLTVELLGRVRPMLSEERFGIEPQIIASLARLGETVRQVPVSYDPRGLSAGKKIGWVDGLRAVYVIARERMRGGVASGTPEAAR